MTNKRKHLNIYHNDAATADFGGVWRLLGESIYDDLNYIGLKVCRSPQVRAVQS